MAVRRNLAQLSALAVFFVIAAGFQANATASIGAIFHSGSSTRVILNFFLDVISPWFCLILGFGVALIRPRDKLAWLLLMLLLSFSQVTAFDFELSVMGKGRLSRIEFVYADFLTATWPFWMMLFGQYFPDRESQGRIARATRWILGVPLVAISLWQALQPSAKSAFVRYAFVALSIVAISTFFINIFYKMSTAKNRDMRRRLKLLYVGATVSMTPMFLLFVSGLILKNGDLGAFPEWLVIPAFALMFLFPLTLAHVIVVERAMELRVVVRRSLQYALATRGVRVLQVLISAAILMVAFRMSADPTLRRPQQLTILAWSVLSVAMLRRLVDWLRPWVDRKFFREAVNAEQVLSELSDKVRTFLAIEPLLETVSQDVSSSMHVPRVTALIERDGHYVAAHTQGYDSSLSEIAFETSGTVATRLKRAGGPLRIARHMTDWTRNMTDVASEQKSLELLDTELLLPLATQDRLLGFLSLGPKLSEEPYSPTDLRLLGSVATQTGLALENTRLTAAVASEVAQRERLNRELEIAREVQERLFPQSGPSVGGLEYSGRCRPASSVGGDYYDFVGMADGSIGFAIGDISGKGVPAALLMASLQASLRGLAISNPGDLAAMMTNLNRLIYDATPSNRYATFFFGVYQPETRRFLYVNGGHNPPMLFRGDQVLRLEQGGPVVGLFGPAQYEQGEVIFQGGDVLVLFTDGVSEAMNAEDDEFGEDRMMDGVRSNREASSTDLIERLMGGADQFAAGAPQHDDMTLVVVRVTD